MKFPVPTSLALSASLLALSTPVAAEHHEEKPAPAHSGHHEGMSAAEHAQMTETQKLHTLFKQADENKLDNSPLEAMFRGDMRNADQFGDYITDAYFNQQRETAQGELETLMSIDRSALSPVDQIAYDVFKRTQESTLEGLTPEMLALTAPRPVNHFFGFHTFYPGVSSGKGAAPFKTVEDYENALMRHDGFITFNDRSIGRMRQGMETGVVETTLTITNVIDQLKTQLALPVEESPYYLPVVNMPDDFSDEEKTRLTAAFKDKIANGIYPSLAKLRDFLRDDYLPVTREDVGLWSMPGGDKLYANLIEDTTTLPLSADYVHDLGLSEVARIHEEMEKVKQEVGFDGTLKEFFEFIRTDPQFHPESREGLTEAFYEVGEKVDQRIGELFSVLPKSPLEIRPYEEYREKYEAGGSYQSGTPDGSRPGVFYFNAYDLPSRSIPGITTLYLHEGAPGHHFQISLAQENEALPNFMRFGGNTAYVEGWALYSEKLGYPLGLYEDPYQRFGHLDDEMLRAMRLVVDSGIHAKKWTRDQAIQYMLDNSSMGKTDATAEVERYIAIPSQALAYKIGALTIQKLRGKAEAALGDAFDIREFHQQVLGTGALPMTVLETKIDDWIASKKG